MPPYKICMDLMRSGCGPGRITASNPVFENINNQRVEDLRQFDLMHETSNKTNAILESRGGSSLGDVLIQEALPFRWVWNPYCVANVGFVRVERRGAAKVQAQLLVDYEYSPVDTAEDLSIQ